jgi:uncharacterized membrane protein YqhA
MFKHSNLVGSMEWGIPNFLNWYSTRWIQVPIVIFLILQFSFFEKAISLTREVQGILLEKYKEF